MRASVDVEVARWVSEHRSDHVTAVCRFLEDVGTTTWFFALTGLALLVVVAVLRLWLHLPRVAIAMLLAAHLSSRLKPWIDRPRPGAEYAVTFLPGPSMPSSHAVFASSAVASVVLAGWWTSRRLQQAVAAVGVAGCLVSGAAMVYLGGHWVTDVLAGWLLGVAVVAAVMYAPGPRPRPRGAHPRER